MPPDEPNPEVGRPTKYKDEYAEQAYKLCLLGFVDTELAEFFEVSEATINNWKSEHPEFLESIKRGKDNADMEVAHNLYRGTADRTVVETQAIKIKVGKDEEDVKVVEVERVIPADFRNQSLWLRNRRRKNWTESSESVNKNLNMNADANGITDESRVNALSKLFERIREGGARPDTV